jgi:hypothetical protein
LSTSFDFYGGIDFSGAREPLQNLWSALGRESAGKLEIVSLRPHAFRADLASYVASDWRASASTSEASRILWGVNFPLGLPAPATRHLLGDQVGWPDLLPWVADRPPDEIRDAVPDSLREPRVTDVGITPSPLDARNYKLALEGIRWLHELRETTRVAVHPQAPDGGATSALIEVNPAASAHELGLPRRRAPGRPGETRARAAALRTFLTFGDRQCEALAVTLEDAWDATLSCLAAYLARDDLAQPARLAQRAIRQVGLEGWIYRIPDAAQT